MRRLNVAQSWVVFTKGAKRARHPWRARLSVDRNLEYGALIVRILGGLLTGETSVRQFHVDEVCRRLSDAGVLEDMVIDLRDEAWGPRHFLFRDPAGTLLDIVQLVPPSTEYVTSYSTTERPTS